MCIPHTYSEDSKCCRHTSAPWILFFIFSRESHILTISPVWYPGNFPVPSHSRVALSLAAVRGLSNRFPLEGCVGSFQVSAVTSSAATQTFRVHNFIFWSVHFEDGFLDALMEFLLLLTFLRLFLEQF